MVTLATEEEGIGDATPVTEVIDAGATVKDDTDRGITDAI